MIKQEHLKWQIHLDKELTKYSKMKKEKKKKIQDSFMKVQHQALNKKAFY